MSFPARPERQRLNGLCRSGFVANFSTMCEPAQALRLISQHQAGEIVHPFVEEISAWISHW